MIVRIGKSKIEIRVEGCIKCGTLWSHHWEKVKEVPVQIGSSRGVIDVHVCGNCLEREAAGQLQFSFGEVVESEFSER